MKRHRLYSRRRTCVEIGNRNTQRRRHSQLVVGTALFVAYPIRRDFICGTPLVGNKLCITTIGNLRKFMGKQINGTGFTPSSPLTIQLRRIKPDATTRTISYVGILKLLVKPCPILDTEIINICPVFCVGGQHHLKRYTDTHGGFARKEVNTLCATDTHDKVLADRTQLITALTEKFLITYARSSVIRRGKLLLALRGRAMPRNSHNIVIVGNMRSSHNGRIGGNACLGINFVVCEKTPP